MMCIVLVVVMKPQELHYGYYCYLDEGLYVNIFEYDGLRALLLAFLLNLNN